MKKAIAVVVTVCVVFVAGAAFAGHRMNQGFRNRMVAAEIAGQHLDQRQPGQAPKNMPNPHIDQRQPGQFKPCDPEKGPAGFDRRPGPRRPMFAPDMPKEIKDKVVEAAKLRIDLEAVLSEKPIDKAKAIEIFTQIQKAEQEVEVWKFGKKLERMEAFRNRKMPPAPKAPAPEAPAENAD